MVSFTPEKGTSVYEIEAPLDYYCVHVKAADEKLSQNDNNLYNFPYFPKLSSATDEITSEFRKAVMFRNRQKERSTLKIWDILWCIQYDLKNETAKSEKYNPLLDKAYALIDDQLTENIYPCEIAKQLGVSLTHLNRLCNKEKGVSLGKYIISCKMERVVSQLQTTDKTLKLIAYESGFKDLQYFNKVCHKYFGVSPRKLRGCWRK